MASTQEFRRRIKSVNSTKQITKAMEMVASVKMQKSIKSILEARTYVQSSWNMLVKLAENTLPSNHRLISPAETDKTALIFVSSDRGLCGSFNTDLFKKLIASIKELNNKVDIIAIGKKGAEYIKNHNIGNVVAVFDGLDKDIALEDIIPVSVLTNGEYLNGKYSKVSILYSHFASSLKQIPVVKQILPLDRQHIDLPDIWVSDNVDTTKEIEFKFEPDPDVILDKLLRRIVRMQIFGAVLESNAAEHSARMIAMKNATDNATDLISELTLTYNSIRQNSITSEIAEIASAAEAIK